MPSPRRPVTPTEPLATHLGPLVRPVNVWRHRRSRPLAADHDEIVVEEPLELRVDGHPLAVLMRTPGDDLDLVRGLLLAEGLVRSSTEIAAIGHCRSGSPAAAAGNVVLVTRRGAPRATLARARRRLMASSACGICGRQTIDDLATRAAPVAPGPRLDPDWVLALPNALRARQPAFARTGGLHAAALCVPHGGGLKIVALREDVGRHNAVDKVIGAAMRAHLLPLSNALLFVSGRAGYEIVQKARVAGIPIVAAVSAPSSLAVELAQAGGQTLVAFVRDDRLNVYCGPERLASPPSARAARSSAPPATPHRAPRARAPRPPRPASRSRNVPRDRDAKGR